MKVDSLDYSLERVSNCRGRLKKKNLNQPSIEESLRREVEEEIGLTSFESFGPLDTVVSNIEIPLKNGQKAGLVLSVYDFTKGNDPIQLSEEHTEFSWVSPLEASHLLSYKYPSVFTERLMKFIS